MLFPRTKKPMWTLAGPAALALSLTLGMGAVLWAQDNKPAAADKAKPADKPAAAEKTDKPAEKPAAEAGKTTTTASGLKITVVEEAKNPGAMPGDIVWVHYTGKLSTGEEFDSSVGKQPFKFTLGGGQVIKGWDEGVVGMKVGEKRQLTIPADLGYGARGAPPKIPGGATLVFDIEMIGLARPGK
jgi:FKBP-type peptidyl-prolyl cis-trans isomerase